jgi:hypothetical protein
LTPKNKCSIILLPLIINLKKGDTLKMAPKNGPLQKPGEKPARPGEYVERGPQGGEVQKPRQVTIDPGDKPLPPTQKPGRTWERQDPPKKPSKK